MGLARGPDSNEGVPHVKGTETETLTRERALTLCAGYCDATDGAVRLRLITDGGTREATVIPLPREAARAWML